MKFRTLRPLVGAIAATMLSLSVLPSAAQAQPASSTLLPTPSSNTSETSGGALIPVTELGIDAPAVKVDSKTVKLSSIDTKAEKDFLKELSKKVQKAGGGVIVSAEIAEYGINSDATTPQPMTYPGACTLKSGMYFTYRATTYSTLSHWSRNDCPTATQHLLELDLYKKKAGATGSGTNVAWLNERDNDAELDYSCLTGYVAEYNGITRGQVVVGGKVYTRSVQTDWARYACGG